MIKNKFKISPRFEKLIRRFGVLGFVFFFLKGIAWLVFGGAIFEFLKTLID
jgi:hypothetical protein